MKEPVLVIMAAGMGSRYGGLKQIDPIDEEGHMIIDFSIYDAIRAGFKKIVFIIKKEIEDSFKSSIGDRMSKHIEVEYVYQDINNLPEGFLVPEGRIKPWGTGHAVLSCLNTIDGPFAVINADDYYGLHAFEMIYNYLIQAKDENQYHYTMVGYVLENTLTDHGYVARGVCETNPEEYLMGIQERTHIENRGGVAMYTEDDSRTWNVIPRESTVSMNMWGFTPSILTELQNRFTDFLESNLKSNPLKAEYFLPNVVGDLITENKATVKVLKTPDKWYGVTYKEDKEVVTLAITRLKEKGIYPSHLW